MTRTTTLQSDFTSGELSPRLIARTDLESVKRGVKEMTNAYPLIHGGVTRRLGTRLVGEVDDSSKECLLIPYIFSRDVSYIVVLNNGLFQFIENGQFIESSPGNRVSVACTYSEDEYPDIRYAQLGASLFIVHPDHPPRTLKSTTSTLWTLTEPTFEYRAVTGVEFQSYYVYFKIIAGNTPFEVGDRFVITTSGDAIAAGGSPPNAGDGRIIGVDIQHPIAVNITVECTVVDDDREEWDVFFELAPPLSNVPVVADWIEHNYPKSVTVYEQRLWFGGTTTSPQTIFASGAGDYLNFTVGSRDSDGLKFSIASDSADELIHIKASRNLLALTSGTEFVIAGSSTVGITPSSIRVAPQTYHGSTDAPPIRIGNELIFIQRGKRIARAISYSLEYEQNIAPDITVLAEHITDGNIKTTTFNQTPDYTIWMIKEDGTLISVSRLVEYNQTGWAQHNTLGLFEGCATIPGANFDNTFFVVNRTIDGQTKRFVEVMDYSQPIYTDCSITLTSSPATKSWSGLDHLEGEEVSVVADGKVHPPVTVTSGSITLQYKASSIDVGLPYYTKVKMLHPLAVDTNGQSIDKKVSIRRIIIEFQDTISCRVNGKDIAFRTFSDLLDTALPSFTGQKEVTNMGWSEENNITLEQVLPLHWTILSTTMFITFNE